MLNKISIGRFYPVSSQIHKMHPCLKFILSIIFIACVLSSKQLESLLTLLAFLILILGSSNIPYCHYGKCIWMSRYFLIGLFLFNVILDISFLDSGIIILKLILIILETTMILSTTTTQELIDAFSIFLTPFKIFKLSTNQMAASIGLSISFIPSILEKSDIILKSLQSRGIWIRKIKWEDKFMIWIAILYPLFLSSFKHADQLAETMEMRMYDWNQRYYKRKNWTLSYYDLFLIVLHLFLGILVWKEGIK